MNKREKLTELDNLRKSLGLSYEDVVQNWVSGRAISRRSLVSVLWNTKLVPRKKDKNGFVPLPGMYCYSDGSFADEVIEGKEISGVAGVVYPRKRKVLCVALDESCEQWPDCGDKIETSYSNGQRATLYVADVARRAAYVAPATDYCLNYDNHGVRKGEAFIFSKHEAQSLQPYLKDYINPALKKIGAPVLGKCFYWTSTWAYVDYAYVVYMYDRGHIKSVYVYNHYDVRPVFWRNY